MSIADFSQEIYAHNGFFTTPANDYPRDTAAIAADIAHRCQKSKQTKDGWQACCPSHDDHTPSLTITPIADKVLVKCHGRSGCTAEAITTALGMTLADLYATPKASTKSYERIVKVYDYYDANGTLVHQTVRKEPKAFSQRRPDPARPGEYIWSTKDIETVLYNLPQVLAAKAKGETIYLPEGEKDCDALTALGLTATTNPMGGKNWRQSYTETLQGADVVVLPDNDKTGREHRDVVVQALQGKAKRVTVVNLPHLPEKGDVSDWLKAGGTREQLEVLVQAAQVAQPVHPTQKPLSASMVSFAELLKLQIPDRERYQDWLKERSLVMAYGPRGVGKTMYLLGLSIALASGTPFLKWATHRQVGVLYVDGEMTLADLTERALSLSGGCMPTQLSLLPSELVYENSFRNLTLTREEDQREVEVMLEANPNIKVLVLDNIACLFPGISENEKKDWEPVNAWFIRLRHKGITVIVGHHAGKDGKQRGTSGREDSLDTVISLSLPDNHNPEEGCHFHLTFEKSRGIKGSAIQALDVRLEELPDQDTVWTWAPLDTSRTERVTAMLLDGVSVRDIAEEMGVSKSYVHRVKRSMGVNAVN